MRSSNRTKYLFSKIYCLSICHQIILLLLPILNMVYFLIIKIIIATSKSFWSRTISDLVLISLLSSTRFDNESVTSKNLLKTSVQRGIRNSVLEQYPTLEPYIEDIIPKKQQGHLYKWCVLIDKTGLTYDVSMLTQPPQHRLHYLLGHQQRATVLQRERRPLVPHDAPIAQMWVRGEIFDL